MKSDLHRAKAATAALAATVVIVAVALVACGAPRAVKEFKWAEFAGELKREKVNNVDYAYFRFGSGPPLVMICGITMTMTQWDLKLLKELKRSFEVMIFDNPGIGESTYNSDEPLSIRGMADGTLALAEKLGIQSPNILGWSMGGEIATTIGALHSDRVDSVVVAAGNAGGGPGFVPTTGKAFETLVGSKATGLERKKQIASVLFPKNQTAAALRYGVGLLQIPQETATKEAIARQMVAVAAWKAGPGVFEQLGTTQTRMLFAGGDQDVIVPIQNSINMANQTPNGSLKTYPDAGHAFLFQEPVSFASEVKRFLLKN